MERLGEVERTAKQTPLLSFALLEFLVTIPGRWKLAQRGLFLDAKAKPSDVLTLTGPLLSFITMGVIRGHVVGHVTSQIN